MCIVCHLLQLLVVVGLLFREVLQRSFSDHDQLAHDHPVIWHDRGMIHDRHGRAEWATGEQQGPAAVGAAPCDPRIERWADLDTCTNPPHR